jgi:drug/metabolite transporter (DMT)-like permease
MILPSTPEDANIVARIIDQAVAPVFLLAGIGAFLNTLTGRLARIVDRGRVIEPRLLEAQGHEHDRLVREINVIDRRMRLVSSAITMTVTSAVLVCAVVSLLFAAALIRLQAGTTIALLFIGAMVTLALGFFIFLIETRVAAKAIRVRPSLLTHEADEAAGDE